MLWSMEEIFWSKRKNNLRTYDNIGKVVTGQGDDYTTGCLLEYHFFEKYYKLIAIDLIKQLDADPKAIQQINFSRNLSSPGIVAMFLIIEKAKEAVLDFSKWTVKVLWFYFVLI